MNCLYHDYAPVVVVISFGRTLSKGLLLLDAAIEHLEKALAVLDGLLDSEPDDELSLSIVAADLSRILERLKSYPQPPM